MLKLPKMSEGIGVTNSIMLFVVLCVMIFGMLCVKPVTCAAPVFTQSSYTVTAVPENEAAGYNLVISPAIEVTDADASVSLTFSLGGTNPTKFVLPTMTSAVSPSASLVIQTAESFDYEAAATYSITVEVTDGTTPVSITLTVPISDVNDNNPVCNPNLYFVTVSENTALGTEVVAALLCNDVDTTSTSLSYSITGVNNFFEVASDGKVTTKTGGSVLDYESATSHALSITVEDETTLSTTVIVVITVESVNEHDPVWDSSYNAQPTYNIKEDDPVGTLVHQLSASDQDDGVDGELKYTLAQVTADDSSTGHQNKFDLDPVNGMIHLASMLERDGSGGHQYYILTVQAADTNGESGYKCDNILVDNRSG